MNDIGEIEEQRDRIAALETSQGQAGAPSRSRRTTPVAFGEFAFAIEGAGEGDEVGNVLAVETVSVLTLFPAPSDFIVRVEQLPDPRFQSAAMPREGTRRAADRSYREGHAEERKTR